MAYLAASLKRNRQTLGFLLENICSGMRVARIVVVAELIVWLQLKLAPVSLKLRNGLEREGEQRRRLETVV